MNVLGQLRAAGRFTLGVLLIWGVVSIGSYAVQSFFRDDSTSSRLRAGQFCTVDDFMASNIFAPTSCYVYDREYQVNPGALKPADHLFIAEIDLDTLVMIEHDAATPSIIKGESGKRGDVDGRLVTLHFISGPLTGRKGMIARYKLN